jgi:hypothetical protein
LHAEDFSHIGVSALNALDNPLDNSRGDTSSDVSIVHRPNHASASNVVHSHVQLVTDRKLCDNILHRRCKRRFASECFAGILNRFNPTATTAA